MQELPILSIDYQKIRKGDVFTEEQVLHHYKYNLLGEEEYNKRVAKFHTKEYVSHPDEYSLMKVKEAIEINCRELGYPVVVKTRKKQILILEDKEAVEYLTDRAESHIDNFKKKVHRLHVDIDEEKLSEFDKKQFEHKKNYYTLVQGHIMQGKKSLKEMRKRKQLEGN